MIWRKSAKTITTMSKQRSWLKVLALYLTLPINSPQNIPICQGLTPKDYEVLPIYINICWSPLPRNMDLCRRFPWHLGLENNTIQKGIFFSTTYILRNSRPGVNAMESFAIPQEIFFYQLLRCHFYSLPSEEGTLDLTSLRKCSRKSLVVMMPD